MSKLIEKVRSAVIPTMWDSEEAAKAAVRAVVDYLRTEGGTDQIIAADWLEAEAVQTGSGVL
jgi:hypothetical protein